MRRSRNRLSRLGIVTIRVLTVVTRPTSFVARV
jgi:hypothetical protein